MPSTTRLTLRPHDQQLHQLPAGAEVRCLQGAVTLLAMPGMGWPLRVLPAGQAMHFVEPTWLTLRTDGGATVAVTIPAQDAAPARESRQALDGLWRLGRSALRRLRLLRRGPRAA